MGNWVLNSKVLRKIFFIRLFVYILPYIYVNIGNTCFLSKTLNFFLSSFTVNIIVYKPLPDFQVKIPLSII